MLIRQKKLLIVFSISVLLAGTATYYAPRLLVYSDKPLKSDVIVLFSRGDNMTREKEAEELLHEGLARYLLVPASGTFHEITADGHLMRLSRDLKVGKKLVNIRKRAYYKDYYEKTHVEALEAKRMMDDLGLVSAIMVSSPYHMRRIRMISRNVFGEQARLFSYVPTRYEPIPSGVGSMRADDLRFITTEFIKICWFRLYSPFL